MTEEGSDTAAHSDEQRPALADQRDVETVYQPAEDSRLLADTVVEETERGSRVLDVGTGSGYVAWRLREEADANAVGTDLNPEACAQAANQGVPVVRGNLFGPFRDAVFDVVVCNPPYLPTPAHQEWDDWMERALSGGEDGRAMIDPFLEGVSRVLRTPGVAYVLMSTLTDPDAVRVFAEKQGLTSEIIAEESYPFEKLLVVRFSREDAD